MSKTPTESALHLGPSDQGKLLTEEDYLAARTEPGWKYELVAGRLDVSPLPELNEWFAEDGVLRRLFMYSIARPDVIAAVTGKARVIARGLGAPTNVEPDITAFRRVLLPGTRWSDAEPLLTVEVVTPSHPEKDYRRNRALYALVPSIREYWIVDPRQDPARPAMLALTRDDAVGPWREQQLAPGGVYSTPLLPGFVLDLGRLAER